MKRKDILNKLDILETNDFVSRDLMLKKKVADVKKKIKSRLSNYKNILTEDVDAEIIIEKLEKLVINSNKTLDTNKTIMSVHN